MCFHIWKYEFESALLANTAMNTTKTDFYIILLYYNEATTVMSYLFLHVYFLTKEGKYSPQSQKLTEHHNE